MTALLAMVPPPEWPLPVLGNPVSSITPLESKITFPLPKLVESPLRVITSPPTMKPPELKVTTPARVRRSLKIRQSRDSAIAPSCW